MVEDPPWLEKEKEESKGVRVDWLGLGLVALAFGSLQIILDKGQQDDWFSSPLIVVFTMVMVICMVGTVVWEWAHPNPIVNVRLFLNRNFATSAALMFTLGAVLYGSTVLIPQFVQTLMGYSAERAGMVLSPGGFTTMAMMPLVGFLVSRVPAKYLITLGFAGLSLSLWHMTSINLGIDPHTATMYRVYQAASLAFLFVPINTVAYIGVPREQNNQVSGPDEPGAEHRRERGHRLLRDHARPELAAVPESSWWTSCPPRTPALQERLAQLQQTFSSVGPADALRRAYAAIYLTIQQQAALLSYIRVIEDLAVVTAIFVPLILLFLKKNRPGAGPAGAH